MKEPFEVVEADERRLILIEDAPQFHHTVTREQLGMVKNETTAERWILMNVIGQKLDWLIERHIKLNNDCYHLETEIVRSKKFRQYLWTRITMVVAVSTAIVQTIAWLVQIYLHK
jgi:hypothetical protein